MAPMRTSEPSTVVNDGQSQSSFTIVANALARDPSIKTDELGMLVYLMTHQAGYQLKMEQIYRERDISRESCRRLLNRLETKGWLSRARLRSEDGTLGAYQWQVNVTVNVQVSTSARKSSTGSSSTGDPGSQERKKTNTAEDQENETSRARTREGDHPQPPPAPEHPSLSEASGPPAPADDHEPSTAAFDLFRGYESLGGRAWDNKADAAARILQAHLDAGCPIDVLEDALGELAAKRLTRTGRAPALSTGYLEPLVAARWVPGSVPVPRAGSASPRAFADLAPRDQWFRIQNEAIPQLDRVGLEQIPMVRRQLREWNAANPGTARAYATHPDRLATFESICAGES